MYDYIWIEKNKIKTPEYFQIKDNIKELNFLTAAIELCEGFHFNVPRTKHESEDEIAWMCLCEYFIFNGSGELTKINMSNKIKERYQLERSCQFGLLPTHMRHHETVLIKCHSPGHLIKLLYIWYVDSLQFNGKKESLMSHYLSSNTN